MWCVEGLGTRACVRVCVCPPPTTSRRHRHACVAARVETQGMYHRSCFKYSNGKLRMGPSQFRWQTSCAPYKQTNSAKYAVTGYAVFTCGCCTPATPPPEHHHGLDGGRREEGRALWCVEGLGTHAWWCVCPSARHRRPRGATATPARTSVLALASCRTFPGKWIQLPG